MQASEGRDKKSDSAILGVFTEDGLPPSLELGRLGADLEHVVDALHARGVAGEANCLFLLGR
jgi:hypothetical protein